jgi:membrane-associated protease RseP (regulator of RpoE activity)
LDGGHLFLIGLEKLRGRALSIKTDQIVAKAGFALIIMLALFVFYSDFDRVGWIDKMVRLFKGTGL